MLLHENVWLKIENNKNKIKNALSFIIIIKNVSKKKRIISLFE